MPPQDGIYSHRLHEIGRASTAGSLTSKSENQQLFNSNLVFLVACCIPPKSNSLVKTISIFADGDFSPLRTFIFSRFKLVAKNVNKYENRLHKLK